MLNTSGDGLDFRSRGRLTLAPGANLLGVSRDLLIRDNRVATHLLKRNAELSADSAATCELKAATWARLYWSWIELHFPVARGCCARMRGSRVFLWIAILLMNYYTCIAVIRRPYDICSCNYPFTMTCLGILRGAFFFSPQLSLILESN